MSRGGLGSAGGERATEGWRRAAACVGVALLALGPVTPNAARAQPMRTRILRGLQVSPLKGGFELRVQFGVPVRYVRHAPAHRGTSLEIQLDPVTTNRSDSFAALANESLQPPRGAQSPVQAVTYIGDGAAGSTLEVGFTRLVEFEVEGGRDMRSIIVRVRDPARPRSTPPDRRTMAPPAPPTRPTEPEPAPPAPVPVEPTGRAAPAPVAVPSGRSFALQLYAGPAEQPPPAVPALPELRGRIVYAVPFRKDGAAWRRLRLGFYPSVDAADRDRSLLAPRFPGAFVVATGAADRSAARTGRAIPDASRAARPPAGSAAPPGRAPTAEPAPSLAVAGAASEPSPSAGEPPAAAPSPSPSRAPTPRASTPPEATASADAALMQRGRDALAAGKLPLAISLFTKVASGPEGPDSPEARELLGLARERAGQMAHAKAAYEDYLERYPGTEGAVRVRQRLDAMLTARAPARGKLREARARSAVRWDVYGSISSAYRRAERNTDLLGSIVIDDSLYSGLFAAARRRSDRFDVQAQVNGSYLFDFLGDGRSDDEERISTLFLEVDSLRGGLSGTLGRQSGNSRGVIGRMDGGLLTWSFGEHWSVSGVAGFPVDFDARPGLDTSRRFYGLSVDASGLLEGLDAQLYGIHQTNGSFTDRTAVGGELRWFAEGRYLSALVDYDIHYGSLNTAFLTGSWQVTPATGIHLYGDYRNSPVLTTRNALIGETATSLDDLRLLYTDAQIEQLAEARTSTSKLATLGATQQLTDRWQLAADVSVAEFDFTDPAAALAEVQGLPVIDSFEGSGLELSYFAQLIGSGLFRDGDVGLLGLRYTDGQTSDRAAVLLSARFPLLPDLRLRLGPRIDVIQQRFDARDPLLFVRPGLRVDYRLGKLFLDLDASFEWVQGERTPGAGNETGYVVGAGARYDF